MTASAGQKPARVFRRMYATSAGFDDLAMESDGDVLTALHFVSGKRPAPGGDMDDLPVFRETCRWLDRYFSGRDPGPPPPFRPDFSEIKRFRTAAICRHSLLSIKHLLLFSAIKSLFFQ